MRQENNMQEKGMQEKGMQEKGMQHDTGGSRDGRAPRAGKDVAPRSLRTGGYTFLAVGVAFLGVAFLAGQEAFTGVGFAFLGLGLAFAANARRR
jgi:hypothetical protein